MDIKLKQSDYSSKVYYLSFNDKIIRLQLMIYSKAREAFRVQANYGMDYLTPHFEYYFEDWKNPTEDELIAFCLEHDIEY